MQFRSTLTLLTTTLVAGTFACSSVEREVPPDELIVSESFDAEAGRSLPRGWQIAETASRGMPATWGLVDAASGKTGLAFAVTKSSNLGKTFNLAVLDGANAKDFHARLKLRAISGREDQGGGLCWRLLDADNYYITRWNPLEDNLRLYIVREGVRHQLATAQVLSDRRAWHELDVIVSADRVEIQFDGRSLIKAEDSQILAAGGFALWSKADACTAFDNLRIW